MDQKRIEQMYDRLDDIGSGTYGMVYRARSKSTGQMFAIKEIKRDSNEEGIQSSALREISLLLELDHPNILKIYEVYSDRKSEKVSMVLELLDLDMYRLMRSHPTLMPSNPNLVKYYMYQLLTGLAYCHSRRVIHRDIKPQNLLINLKRNEIKLADFGLARSMGFPVRCLSPEVVTLWYRPPELLLSSKTYSATVDIWSVGCILYEMSLGKPLFPGSGELDQLVKIFKVIGTPDEASWPGVGELSGFKAVAGSILVLNQQQMDDQQRLRNHISSATNGINGIPIDRIIIPDPLAVLVSGSQLGEAGQDLVRWMLRLNPSQRPSTKEALDHRYFNDINDILANPPRLI